MSRREAVKRLVAGVATTPPARGLFQRLIVGRIVVFMMHRFADLDLGSRGHDVEHVRRALDLLRREGMPLLSLTDAVAAVEEGRPRSGIVFTVDDGYEDFHSVGARIFAEFDCPVTVFLTTGFLDGECWFWWDRIEHALSTATTGRIRLPPRIWEGGRRRLPLVTPSDRRRAHHELVESVKSLPEDERSEVVDAVLERLERPEEGEAEARARYAPMTWNQVRELADTGVTFGPHSVTHASLSTADEESVEWEITESSRRLAEEIEAPVPVFCYPYGMHSDVSEDAASAVKRSGLAAAVTAIGGYVSPPEDQVGLRRFLLPRFPFPDRLTDLRQIVHGFERFKVLARRAVGG